MRMDFNLRQLDQLIVFITPSETAVCLHEAGHAVAALVCGADLKFVEFIDNPLSEGVARNSVITSNQAERKFVACAGYAVEYNLFLAQRLVDAAGVALLERAFIQKAIGNNAAFDKRQFFDEDREQSDGDWPKNDDLEFMETGQKMALKIPMDIVFSVATALLNERHLDCQRVLEITEAVQMHRT